MPSCGDDTLVVTTRRQFLEQHAGQPILVLGTHFASPSAGWIVRDGAVYRYEV